MSDFIFQEPNLILKLPAVCTLELLVSISILLEKNRRFSKSIISKSDLNWLVGFRQTNVNSKTDFRTLIFQEKN